MTRIIGIGCGLVFLMWCATGCRSEQVAFQFQPVMPQAASSALDTIMLEKPVGTADAVSCLPLSASAASKFPVHKYQRKRKSISSVNATACSTQLSPRFQFQNHSPASTVIVSSRSIDAPPWGDILFLLGGAICVGAVIIGINIGGWLGLVVGTTLYLTSAYLIARIYGGPNKPALANFPFKPTRLRRKSAFIRKSDDSDSAASVGEWIFILGSLMIWVALILGLTGLLSGTAALLLGLISFLLAIAAYSGFKW